KSRHALILQLIANMPDIPFTLAVSMKLFPQDDGEVYQKAKALWLQQVERHPEKTGVLQNAAAFFQVVDAVMAGRLLRKCKELEPKNPRWATELGQLYSFQGDPQQPESYKDWGLMSLSELESAWQPATAPNERFYALMRLPAVALQAWEFEKA